MDLADTGERLGEAIRAGWVVVLIFGVLIGAISFVVSWAILKSAEKPAPTLLVMSLSMLTLLSIVAFVVSGSQEMGTLAGVGLGALAAAVSTMFGRIGHNTPPEDLFPPHSAQEEDPDPYSGEPEIPRGEGL